MAGALDEAGSLRLFVGVQNIPEILGITGEHQQAFELAVYQQGRCLGKCRVPPSDEPVLMKQNAEPWLYLGLEER